MGIQDSKRTGRLRLLHLREVIEAAEEEMVDERVRFTKLARNDAATRAVSAFNLFQTPESLATRLVEILGRRGRTLEPSAGLGRIYRAIRAADSASHVTLVEQAADCCRELYLGTKDDESCRLIQGDFLEQTPDKLGLFDCIAMNPPFKMWRDIKHILHAKSFLAAGGRLVAICAAGPRQREKLQPVVDQWIDLPPGSFKESFTNVAAAVVVIDLK